MHVALLCAAYQLVTLLSDTNSENSDSYWEDSFSATAEFRVANQIGR